MCLFCLKGNSVLEDVLLNLAGMFAPVVALVPTPDPGVCRSSFAKQVDSEVQLANLPNIANNATALLLVGLVALIVIAAVAARRRPGLVAPSTQRSRRSSSEAVVVRIGCSAAVAVWIAAAVGFWLERGFFVNDAHYSSAGLMFVGILAVVVVNAFGYRDKKGTSLRNRYIAIAGAMVASSLAICVTYLLDWSYWLLAMEVDLIGWFAVFWIVQTKELWGEGLRRPALGPRPPALK